MWTTVYDLRGNPIMKFNRIGDKYEYQYYNSKKNEFDDMVLEEGKEKFQTNLGNLITLKKATLKAPNEEIGKAQEDVFDNQYKTNKKLENLDSFVRKGGLGGANANQIISVSSIRELIKKNKDLERAENFEDYVAGKRKDVVKAYDKKKENYTKLEELYKRRDSNKGDEDVMLNSEIRRLSTDLEAQYNDTSDYEDELERKKSYEPKEYVSKRNSNWRETTPASKYWDETAMRRIKNDRELAEQLARQREIDNLLSKKNPTIEESNKSMELINELEKDYENGKMQSTSIADTRRVREKYPNLTTDQIRKDKEAANAAAVQRYTAKRPASTSYETPASISKYIK